MSSTTITLGAYLRDRRARLQPGPDAPARRRTAGLRREEIALRAGVSVTWYACLEQGRGGPPSEDVLERLARALELDGAARELLFLLAQQRPPPLTHVATPRVPATLQRVLDGIRMPALVKTATWDIVAWNDALSILTSYEALPPRDRNLLRRMFTTAGVRAHLVDWEAHARAAIAIFRMDVARMGGSTEATALEAELSAASPDFRRFWAETDVQSHGMGSKRMLHPVAGLLGIEYSAFPVEGAEGLTMVIFTPATAADAAAFERLR